MADALMLAVAAALAGKAAEAALEGGRTAWGRMVRLVREHFAHDAAAAALLETTRPTDEASIGQLALTLERAAAADDGFASRLRELWPQAQAELSASAGGVVNVASGTVGGHLIQVRDLRVEGGLRLGEVQRPEDC